MPIDDPLVKPRAVPPAADAPRPNANVAVIRKEVVRPIYDSTWGGTNAMFGRAVNWYNGHYAYSPADGGDFWSDPQRIARYKLALDAMPENHVPDWLDVDRLNAAYGYLENKTRKPWTAWSYNDSDNDLKDFMSGMMPPPVEALPDADKGFGGWSAQNLLGEFDEAYATSFEAYNDEDRALRGAIENLSTRYGVQQDQLAYVLQRQAKEQDELQRIRTEQASAAEAAEFERLPAWHKSLLTVLGSPEFQGAVTGLSTLPLTVALAGPVGMAAPFVGAGVGSATRGAKDQAKAQKFLGVGAQIGYIFNLPAEGLERTLGVIGQLAGSAIAPDWYGSFEDVINNLPAAWRAAHLTYETLNIGKLDAVADEYNVVRAGKAEPIALPSTDFGLFAQMKMRNDVAAIMDAYKDDPKTRKDVLEQYYAAVSEYYGLTGMGRDLLLQVLGDPLNLLPLGESVVGEKIAASTGQTSLARAFRITRGHIPDYSKLDKLSGFNRAFASVSETFNATGGLWTDVFPAYRSLVRNSPSELERLSGIGLAIAGVAREGDVFIPTYLRSRGIQGRLAGKLLDSPLLRPLELTAQSRAHMATVDALNGIHFAIGEGDSPKELTGYLRGMMEGNPEKAGEAGAVYIMSPEGQAFSAALSDQAQLIDDLYTLKWETGTPPRNALHSMADILYPDDPNGAYTLLKRISDEGSSGVLRELRGKLKNLVDAGDNKSAKLLTMLDDPNKPLTASDLDDIAGKFLRGDWAYSPAEYKAILLDELAQRIDKWSATFFNVKPDPLIVRLGNLVKTAQSGLLLGLNPNFLVQNWYTNLVTMGYTGVFGIRSEKTNMRFWQEIMGMEPPQRLRSGVGAAGIGSENAGVVTGIPRERAEQIGVNYEVGTAISDAAKKKGLLSDIESVFSRINKKLGIATNASQHIERMHSAVAYTTASENFMGRTWRAGEGFSEMEQALAQKLLDVGIQPENIYSVISGNYRKGGIESALFENYSVSRIERVASPEQLDLLHATGIYDDLARGIAEAKTQQDVARAFDSAYQTAFEGMQKRVHDNLRADVAQNYARVISEGTQSAVEAFDRIAMEGLEFNVNHWDNMERIYRDAAAMRKREARLFKEREFAKSAQEWNLYKQRRAAQVVGVVEALGGGGEGELGSITGMVARDIQGQNFIWDNFYKERSRLWNLLFDADENKPNSLARLDAALRETLGEQFAIDESSPDIYGQYARAIRDATTLQYRHAIGMEDALQSDIDEHFSKLFSEQLGTELAEVKAWRESARNIRALQTEAHLYFRTGDASGLDALGENGKVAKIAIDNILKGKQLYSLGFDEQKTAWTAFETFYKQLLVKQAQENQLLATRMYQAADGIAPSPQTVSAAQKIVVNGREIELSAIEQAVVGKLAVRDMSMQELYRELGGSFGTQDIAFAVKSLDRKAIIDMPTQKLETATRYRLDKDIAQQLAPKPPKAKPPSANQANIIRALASEFGIASSTADGKPLDFVLLKSINKYSEQKFKSLAEVPYEVAFRALVERCKAKKQPVPDIATMRVPDEYLEFVNGMLASNTVKELHGLMSDALADAIPDENGNFGSGGLDIEPFPAILSDEQIGKYVEVLLKNNDDAVLSILANEPSEINRTRILFAIYDADPERAFTLSGKLEGFVPSGATGLVPPPRGQEALAISAPLGATEAVFPPPIAAAEADGFQQVRSVLDDLSSRYRASEFDTPTGGITERIRAGLLEQNPNITPGELETQVKDIVRDIRKYLGGVYNDLASTKLAALRFGEMQRDAALLNYSRRTNFDGYLNTVFPYQFWYTRSMMNWAIRAIEKPALFSNYYRLRNFQQNVVSKPGFPTRLRKKIKIPVPFLPSWMGDGIYIDPMKIGFPPEQLLGTFDRLYEQNNQLQRRASSIIQQQAADGSISAQEANDAINNMKGSLWENALAQARSEIDEEIANPFDFGMAMIGASLPVQWGYWAATGRKERIGQLPFTRMIQAVTAGLGIGKPGGVNLERGIRETLGLPIVDRFYDYRVDRMLAGMAADGTIDAKTAQEAMVNRSGDAYDLALRRVGTMGAWQYFGVPLALDFFPEGEQEQRLLRSEYSDAIDKWHRGDEGAITRFFDDHPEYEAQLAAFRDPDERLKRFLISEVWEKWNELPSIYKDQVKDQLGSLFNDSFLNKETRSYDALDAQTLAMWAKALGATLPKDVEAPSLSLKLAEPEVARAVDDYYSARDMAFPEIKDLLKLYYSVPEEQRDIINTAYPQIDRYYNWRTEYLAEHPEIIPWVTSESNELYGLPTDIQSYVYNFRAQRDKMFPNYREMQNEYFSLDEDKRGAYLQAHPKLREYWDFVNNMASMNPKAAPYIMSESSLNKRIMGYSGESILSPEEWGAMSPTLQRQLMDFAYGGDELTSGAITELSRLWNTWKKEGTVYEFLDGLKNS